MIIAQFRFELEDRSPLILTYNLQDNSLTPKWVDVVNQRKLETNQSSLKKLLTGNSFPTEPLELKIQNKTADDLPKLMEKLNQIISDINKYYDQPLPLFTNTTEIDHDILNYLHSEFERYGERHAEMSNHYMDPRPNMDPKVWPGIGFKKDFHQLWLDLNQWIHITESAMDTEEFPNFSCLIQYMPFKEQGAPIAEEDKLFLSNIPAWGGLYLGYNTLGKDYVHTYSDNDQRVIANDQVKVQKYLSSEVWLNFTRDPVHQPHHYTPNLGFWQWYKSLPQDLQAKVPIHSLNDLALGRYYLGTVSFDQAFLNFHPVYEDWLESGSDLRRRWNSEVFSKIVKVTGIKIINE